MPRFDSIPVVALLLGLAVASGARGGDAGDEVTTPNTGVEAPTTAELAEPAEQPAQASPPGEAKAGTRRVGIEEIIVTAQKREENIQDVPISINAFSGDELDARGVLDPQDLQLVTPGLVYDTLAGFSLIFLRGIGTDAYLPSADLSIATYVDGVYFPVAHGLSRDLDSVERIEVLKGPQGTLFGRNSTGGAINIVTRNPTDELSASVSSTFGSFDERRVKLFASGPLLWGLSISASGLYGESEDYYDPAPASVVRKFPKEEEKGGRLKLRWAPLDFFDATIAGQLVDTFGTGTSMFANLRPSPLASALGVTPADDYEVANDAAPFVSTNTQVGYLTVNLHPTWFDVKTITAYQDLKNNGQIDFDGSERPIVSFVLARGGIFGQIFTEELQILSNDATPLSRWLEWVGGFYYINSTAGVKKLDATVGGLPQPMVRIFGKLDTESYAGFFQGTAMPLDWLGLTLGGRYQVEERRIFGSRSELLFSDGSTMPFFTFPERTRDDSNFSPKAVLSLRPLDWLEIAFVDDLMTYLSWSKGFKSGTYNVLNINEPGDEVRAEEVTTLELGIKSQFFDGKLRANGAIFRNEIDDLQSQFISLQSGGTTNLENAGKATVHGAEIDTTWAIFPDLILNVGATYLDGVYDEFRNASGFDPVTGLIDTDVDNSGNTVIRTPEYTVNAALLYSLEVWRGVAEVAGDVYYNDGYFFDPQNTATQDAYYLTNARLSYLYEPWNLRITGFGQNLNGAKRYLFKLVNDFGTIGKLAPPVTFGVRLDWAF